MLVKVLTFDGKHKLADRWEEDPYIVQNQPNKDIPVFKIKKENGEGRIKTLHRKLLLPIGYIVDTPTPAPRKRQLPHKPAKRRTISGRKALYNTLIQLKEILEPVYQMMNQRWNMTSI